MKRIWFILLSFLICWNVYAADSEVQDLTDISSPLVSDDMYIVDDPDGTPASKKISIGALLVDGLIPDNITIDLATTAGNAQGVDPDSVALTTGTTGNYVEYVDNGTYITGGSTGSEAAGLTLDVTVAKDLVTTAPITGGTDNIFPGADADITIAITDAQADSSTKGAATFEITDFADSSGEIDLASSVSKAFSSDSGTAVPATHILTIAGGTNVTTSATGSTVTINSSGSGAPTDATYITQVSSASIANAQALADLGSGLMRSATTTGVVTILDDSAGIAANIDDETGSGAMVFGTNPTISDLVVTQGMTVGMTGETHQMFITQASTVGVENAPLITIDDDRAGTTINEKEEATLVIESSSTAAYGIYLNGIAAFTEMHQYGNLLFKNSAANMKFQSDDHGIVFGTTDDFKIQFYAGVTAKFAQIALVSDYAGDNNILVLSLQKDKDFDHAAQTNPTLFVHSATDPDSANDEWTSITHDVTDGVLGVGSGGLKLPFLLNCDTIDTDANGLMSCGSDAGAASGAPTDATYITQVSSASLANSQALGDLGTGIMRSVTTTGVVTTVDSSQGIIDNIDDETGSGVMVFGTNPTISDLVVTVGMTATDPLFNTSITTDYLTASEIVISDASKKIVSAPVATYPSLAELAYLKGATSSVQTQLDARALLTSYNTHVALASTHGVTGDIAGTGGETWTGTHNFDAAFVVQPSTIGTTEGMTRWNSGQKAFEVYTGSSTRSNPSILPIPKVIWDPDGIQSTEDAVPVFYVHPSSYPNGITVAASTGTANDGIQLFADAANTASVAVEEWSYEGAFLSTIATITFANSTVAASTAPLTDANIAAESRIYIDLDDTDLNWLDISIPYYGKGE